MAYVCIILLYTIILCALRMNRKHILTVHGFDVSKQIPNLYTNSSAQSQFYTLTCTCVRKSSHKINLEFSAHPITASSYRSKFKHACAGMENPSRSQATKTQNFGPIRHHHWHTVVNEIDVATLECCRYCTLMCVQTFQNYVQCIHVSIT